MIPDSPLAAAACSQIWQVTALILIVRTFVAVFCKRRAHLAHVLWMLVIIKCLTPPLWSSPTSMFSWLRATAVTSHSETPTAEKLYPIQPSAMAMETRLSFAAGDVSRQSETPAEPAKINFQVVLICWLGGAVICGGLGLFYWLQCWKTLHRCTDADPALTSCARALAKRLGMRRRVRIAVTPNSYGPAALGFFSPAILLPAELARKTPAELEPILAHELIHLRRGDILFGTMQSLAQVLWWFHPLVWWANRHASRAIERCCDEEVIASLKCTPAVYARCLLDVLEFKNSLKSVYLAPGVRPAQVTAQRLENIMKRANGFRQRKPKWCWAVLVITAALVLPGKEIVHGQDQPTAQVPPPKPNTGSKPTQVAPPMPKTQPERIAKAIRLQNALAGDAAAAINEYFKKDKTARSSTARTTS